MDFMYQIQAISDLTGTNLVDEANKIQQEYDLCIGGPNVIQDAENQFIERAKAFVNDHLVDLMKELELSHNRKKTSILVDKVLDNNEPASSK